MPSILDSRGAKGPIPVSLLKGPAAAAELAGHGRPSLGLAQVPASPWPARTPPAPDAGVISTHTGSLPGEGRTRRPFLTRQEKTMFASLPRPGIHPRTAARQAGACLRRVAAVLAAVSCGLLASVAALRART